MGSLYPGIQNLLWTCCEPASGGTTDDLQDPTQNACQSHPMPWPPLIYAIIPVEHNKNPKDQHFLNSSLFKIIVRHGLNHHGLKSKCYSVGQYLFYIPLHILRCHRIFAVNKIQAGLCLSCSPLQEVICLCATATAPMAQCQGNTPPHTHTL